MAPFLFKNDPQKEFLFIFRVSSHKLRPIPIFETSRFFLCDSEMCEFLLFPILELTPICNRRFQTFFPKEKNSFSKKRNSSAGPSRRRCL